MDPQKLSQLDPKLRDAYQRVMGTPVSQTPPPAGGPPPPLSEPQPAITIEAPNTPIAEPAAPTPPAAAAPSQANFTAPVVQTQTVVIKKKQGMMPFLIGIAGLVFIAVYALFWTKIFNFKLPFLP